MVNAARRDAPQNEPSREELDARLWQLVREGYALWGGGKPKGSKNPSRMPAGVQISDYIIKERDALRGPAD